MQEKFDVELVVKQLNALLQGYDKCQELAFEEFCRVLDEFTIVFKALNSFLGMAFSDVKDKISIIQNNNQIFPGHPGFLSFIKMEMEKNIHIYNGENNKAKKAPKEYKKYNSTARNLLRMMWLLTFIRVTFEQISDQNKSMSDILCEAYDAAFGEKHSWIIRKGAKLAIKASSDRKQFVEAVLSQQYNLDRFNDINERFLFNLVPVHEILWQFYRKNDLVDLE